MAEAASSHQSSLTEHDLISAHAGSYHRFMLGLKSTVIVLASLIVCFTMWFASPAGPGWALICGALVAIAGAYAMTHGLAHSTESDNPGGLERDHR